MEWKGGEDTRASRAEGGHQRDRVCYCSCVGGKDRLRWFGHALGWDRKHSRALKRSFMDESQVVLEKRREKF